MDNSIFVDPAIITTPADDESREGVEKWIETLEIWLREALSSHHQWLHLIQATDLLMSEQRFPSFEVLRAWQRKYRLDINPSLILKDVNIFFRDENFDLNKKLEELGYLVEAEKDTTTIHPEQFSSRWLSCIYEEMLQAFVTTCVCKYTEHPFALGLQIATPILLDAKREIVVSATIKDALPDFIRTPDNSVIQTFPLLFTPEDLPLLDIVSLWKLGEQGIRNAIEHQYKQDWASQTTQQLVYKIGTRFIPSVDEKSETTELLLKQIIATMTKIVANKPLDGEHHRHELEEKKGGPQIVRASDNAKAWRITLTRDGAGWRMHYWQIPGGTSRDIIEFSNVLTKKDRPYIY